MQRKGQFELQLRWRDVLLAKATDYFQRLTQSKIAATEEFFARIRAISESSEVQSLKFKGISIALPAILNDQPPGLSQRTLEALDRAYPEKAFERDDSLLETQRADAFRIFFEDPFVVWLRKNHNSPKDAIGPLRDLPIGLQKNLSEPAYFFFKHVNAVGIPRLPWRTAFVLLNREFNPNLSAADIHLTNTILSFHKQQYIFNSEIRPIFKKEPPESALEIAWDLAADALRAEQALQNLLNQVRAEFGKLFPAAGFGRFKKAVSKRSIELLPLERMQKLRESKEHADLEDKDFEKFNKEIDQVKRFLQLPQTLNTRQLWFAAIILNSLPDITYEHFLVEWMYWSDSKNPERRKTRNLYMNLQGIVSVASALASDTDTSLYFTRIIVGSFGRKFEF